MWQPRGQTAAITQSNKQSNKQENKKTSPSFNKLSSVKKTRTATQAMASLRIQYGYKAASNERSKVAVNAMGGKSLNGGLLLTVCEGSGADASTLCHVLSETLPEALAHNTLISQPTQLMHKVFPEVNSLLSRSEQRNPGLMSLEHTSAASCTALLTSEQELVVANLGNKSHCLVARLSKDGLTSSRLASKGAPGSFGKASDCKPAVQSKRLDKCDKFMVLVSSGVSAVMSDQEVVYAVWACLVMHRMDSCQAAEHVARVARQRGGDECAAMVASFEQGSSSSQGLKIKCTQPPKWAALLRSEVPSC